MSHSSPPHASIPRHPTKPGDPIDDAQLFNFSDEDGPIQLSDGTLRCKHALEVCAVCNIDYTFMREILDDDSGFIDSDESMMYLPEEEEFYYMPDMSSNGTRCDICGQPAAVACTECEESLYCSPEHRQLDAQNHASKCNSTTKVEFVVVGTSNKLSDGLSGATSHKYDTSQPSQLQEASDLLKSSKPLSILLIVDSPTTTNDTNLLKLFVTSVKDHGTTVIIAPTTMKAASNAELENIFTEFGLNWKLGQVSNDKITLSPHVAAGVSKIQTSQAQGLAEFLRRSVSVFLPHTYTTEALQITNVSTNEAVYLSSQALADIAGKDSVEAVSAFASVGKGWVGYIGDTSLEGWSEFVVKAMLGL
ncbi:SubName: Full=Uncharacterized protein {ECO:0000313/EMBL:CCA70223.1} [Serendipita indica DSM 11827]|nr:SubName: Full=Uncharacterized protein {ECO:0000313/EMBL:CCA70223.1} [Serendipita indica DSM 11827]